MIKLSTWASGAVLGAVVAIGALTPSTGEAITTTIQNVTVTSTVSGTDVRTWCIAGCAPNQGGGAIWSSGANTVLSSPDTAGNKNLVLTQNPSATFPSFNFDTSEHILNSGAGVVCSAATPCTMTLSIQTSGGTVNVPLALNNELNNFNADPGGPAHAEARNWVTVLNQGVSGLVVAIGYADNAHTDACADTAGSVASNCLPDNPWQGSANTVFVGGTVNTATGGGCDRPNTNNCFDAGAIWISLNNGPTQTPEPASMFLLGAGLIGLAALAKKRN